MIRYLALDVGLRRTGVAFAEVTSGICLPLDTIEHSSLEELLIKVQEIVLKRSIAEVILGLPLLPSGEEGEQVLIVKQFADMLKAHKIPYSLIDERHTTPRIQESDPNAAAACQILQTILERNS